VLSSKYFELLFHSQAYRAIFAGRSNGMTVGLQNLSNQNFYSVRTVVPPLDEQLAIVAHVKRETQAIGAAVSDLEIEIKLLREFGTRLAADVVTGQLDVRDAVARLPDRDRSDAVDAAPAEDIDPENADEEEALP
jgi:type I restriction enzyme S subunit